MDYRFLGKAMTPEQLSSMSDKDRNILCAELRDKILNTVSQNGGHLASNLGVVELTVAMLSVFDYKRDSIVFDVGHQSYSYKLLTGRFERFDTLRRKGGISGFPRISESPYDAFDTGHSSTSISAALGIARARDLNKEQKYVVALIGDGALTGGLSYEAINDLGHSKTKMLVILNDNEMSIDRNVGGLSKYLSKLRISSGYISAKKTTESFLKRLGIVGRALIRIIIAIKDFFRFLIYRKKPSMFEDLGLNYYGPIDGHNTAQLIKAFKAVKDIDDPVIIHVLTRKGKGYSFAENNPSDYHGVSSFDLACGVSKTGKGSYTTAFGGALCELAEKNHKIVAVSAAMSQGTGLEPFSMRFPSRFFDCGIAEEHCVTMAGGMAVSGYIPVVAIYSSFLQRAYDQMISDVCFMNSHVVFAIDRAGFVGADGHTHHGLLDLSYLNSMVNMTVFAPRDYRDLRNCLFYAVNEVKGPVALRYPRGSSPFEQDAALYDDPADCIRPHVVSRRGSDFAVISIGKLCLEAERSMAELENEGFCGLHINLSLVKPVPAELICELVSGIGNVFTVEEGILSGGVGESIGRELADCSSSSSCRVINIAAGSPLIKASTPDDQLRTAGLDSESITSRIVSILS